MPPLPVRARTMTADLGPGPVRQARLTAGLVTTVIFLTAIAPLATDLYVPAFPQVAGDLSASRRRCSSP
jgi:DHA1 family bicyclomycin/chloramphenicol resistance-like MFS transporter